MKFNVFVDKNEEERIDIYIHEVRKIIEDIEEIINGEKEIYGYKDGEIYKLDFSDIVLFTVENEKVYAYTFADKYTVRERLYRIEEIMPMTFLKLNQSSICNIRKIKKFDASVSGTLKVTFINGMTDYVSRRQVKTVKERLGL